MEIHINPANASLSKDISNYRHALKTNPAARDEIEKKLKKQRPNPYASVGFDKFDGVEAYGDFAFGQDPHAEKTQQRTNVLLPRLGGLLDRDVSFAPPAPPAPTPGTTITWPADGGKSPTEIEISDSGAIIHTTENEAEIPEAHEYMEGIFDYILYNIRNRLEAINRALVGYNEVYPTTSTGPYAEVVLAFESFTASLQPGGNSPYAGAFNGVGIFPVVTNEGFIVSVRIELHWKNPYHSSSTIRVP
jgi:hypothetical protein